MSKVVEPATGREQTCEVWSTQIKLPDNVDQVYRYKFIVDGDWVYDSSQPTVANDHGSFDNYFVVSITKLKKLARRNYLLFFKESMRLGWTSSSFVHYSYTFTTTSSKEKSDFIVTGENSGQLTQQNAAIRFCFLSHSFALWPSCAVLILLLIPRSGRIADGRVEDHCWSNTWQNGRGRKRWAY